MLAATAPASSLDQHSPNQLPDQTGTPAAWDDLQAGTCKASGFHLAGQREKNGSI